MKNKTSLGVGIGIGACAAWLAVELWPLFVVGGAGYFLLKNSSSNDSSQKEGLDDILDQERRTNSKR